MGPSNNRDLSNTAIFHFHEYGRKGTFTFGVSFEKSRPRDHKEPKCSRRRNGVASVVGSSNAQIQRSQCAKMYPRWTKIGMISRSKKKRKLKKTHKKSMEVVLHFFSNVETATFFNSFYLVI